MLDSLRREELEKMEILNVLERSDKVKYVIIPKKSAIHSGDKVVVSNDLSLVNKFLEAEEKNV